MRGRLLALACALLYLGFGCLAQQSHAQLTLTGVGGAKSGVAATGCAAIPQSTLTHCWPMDDAHVSGTTITDVTGGLNGTASGAGITSTTGPDGSSGFARAFDGASFISLASNPITIRAAVTVACWINVTNVSSGFPRILGFVDSGTDNTQIDMDSSGPGKINVQYIANDVEVGHETTAQQLTSGIWAHVGFTYDGASTLVVYVNGSSVSTGAEGGFSSATSNIFGARTTGPSNPFTGSESLCVTYSSALSSGNMAALAAVQK